MDKKVEQNILVNQEKGLHLRVAAELVNICKKHDATVTVSCNQCAEADACSILSVLMLGARKGDTVTVSARGTEAQAAVDEISQYFSEGGGI